MIKIEENERKTNVALEQAVCVADTESESILITRAINTLFGFRCFGYATNAKTYVVVATRKTACQAGARHAYQSITKQEMQDCVTVARSVAFMIRKDNGVF
jgi:hypothetical protein